MAEFTKEEAIRLPGEGECGMNETRLESYKNVEHLLREDPHWSNMDAIVCFLNEIAGSLAAIADCMTEKKDEGEEWREILKRAKSEYDEAYRIITCPTPDVTTYDTIRAKTVLETFRNSLGEME